MPEQAPLLGESDLGPVGELARAAEVMDERRCEQQVRVQLGVQLARLVGQRGHRDGVLEQPPEVGMVAPARTRRAPPGDPQLIVGQQ